LQNERSRDREGAVAASFAVTSPVTSKDLHLDTLQMGWVFSALTLACALIEIPGGLDVVRDLKTRLTRSSHTRS
jgi:hypothetical protein